MLASLCRFAAYSLTALVFSACSAYNAAPSVPRTAASVRELGAQNSAALKTPALIGIDSQTGGLEYWPILPGGGARPTKIPSSIRFTGAGAMAGNGDTLAIAEERGAIVLYDIASGHHASLADPYGLPLDIAIDKNAALYVMNDAKPPNVAIYPAGSSQPTSIGCAPLALGAGIAVDNERDIFIIGFPQQSGYGVYEIPRGPNGWQPQDCKRLPLKRDNGTVSGFAIDPKTDDLVVLDNPSQCAGGLEGRMTIYPKPYNGNTGHSVTLGGNCPGGLFLNASSSIVFTSDSDVSGSYSFVRQFRYPSGEQLGAYNGGSPSALTTVPNTLPN